MWVKDVENDKIGMDYFRSDLSDDTEGQLYFDVFDFRLCQLYLVSPPFPDESIVYWFPGNVAVDQKEKW